MKDNTLTTIPDPSYIRSVLTGFAGFVGFNTLYILIIYASTFAGGSVEELKRLWPWGLAVGSLFSVQIGLYSFSRQVLNRRKTGFEKTMYASGGGSLGAMVACCAHLLVLFIPLMGVSLIAGFLAGFQRVFLAAALLINTYAIIRQLKMMKDHGIFSSAGYFSRISSRKLDHLKMFVLALSLPLLFMTYYGTREDSGGYIAESDTTQPATVSAVLQEWEEKSSSAGGVSVNVAPVWDEEKRELYFKISFNTHSVSLNFQVDQIAEVSLDHSPPVRTGTWEGPAPGGHHISGILRMDGLDSAPSSIEILLKGVAGQDRGFEWKN